MDAQGRGGAGGIDPADQWVFNPTTGTYELRPPGAPETRRGARMAAPSSDTRSPEDTAPLARLDPSATAGNRSVPGDRRPPAAGDRAVPRQRDRRAAGGSRRKPKGRGRGKTALTWTGGTLAALLLVGCGTAAYLYNRLNDNITKVDVGIDNGYRAGEPVNILLIGTDKRVGAGNESYGDEGSEGHADTTVLLHFSKDRSHATGLSIPRDLIADVPDCEVTDEDGNTTIVPGEQGTHFNYSLGVDGRDPGCTWRTVEELTGVKINHFVMADFNAVKDLSTAVGGVEVCLAEDIDDPKSHLKLSAGRHRIQGEDALAFVRTRYSVGYGSDLSRIELQQQFLAALAREVQASNTLSNPSKLWDLADAATKALTVDTGIGTVDKLSEVAKDLGQVPVSDISFVTLPVVDNPAEPENAKATVVVDETRAAPLFRMLQEDIPLTDPGKGKGGKGGKGGDSGKGGKQPMAPAEEVRVDVYNGGDVFGAAQDTVTWLQNDHGVKLSTNAGNAPEPQETTTLEYGADQADQAARLAELMGLPKKALKEKSADAGDEPMVLVIGNDFQSAGQPIAVPTKLPDDVNTIQADDKNVCAS